ncbi:MAG: NAD(P)H-dependent glycerol-3-phosphate dehydrogenase, partial [Rhodanobacteraceae bacterium]
IATSRCNRRYLPGVELPATLLCVPNLRDALHRVDFALVAVPSHAFRQMLEEAAPLLPAGCGYAWVTKGFEPGTGRFLHELVAERLPGTPAAVVTGPSFAREVAAGMPTAVTVHSGEDAFAHRVAEMLHGNAFRAYTGNDMLGAELGGAMKNVLAVATGVADGMQLGLNARAGLITRGMNEMLRLGAAIGAQAQTLMGLAGLGDLVLTCTGDLSRNHRFGFALGRGVPLQQALTDIGQVVEGAVTADEVMRLAARHDLDLPISRHVQAVLHGDMTPTDALHSLLARERKPEYPENLFG